MTLCTAGWLGFVGYVATLCLLAGTTVRAAPTSLADIKNVYERDRDAISSDTTAVSEAQATYLKRLAAIERECRKAGDLSGTKAVVAEHARFDATKELPVLADNEDTARLRDARVGYRAALAADARTKQERLCRLTQQHVTALRKCLAILLQQDKMEQAEAVNDEICIAEAVLRQAERQLKEASLADRSRTDAAKPAAGGWFWKKKTWNALTDYSEMNKEGQAWSCGWKPSQRGPFHVFNNQVMYQGNDQWHASAIALDPSVHVNRNKTVSFGVQAGWLAMHPGYNGQLSVIRWTAPRDGMVRIRGVFGAGDEGRVDVMILHGDTTLFRVENTRENEAFSLDARMSRGDVVDFVVGPGTDGFVADSTPLDVTISAR